MPSILQGGGKPAPPMPQHGGAPMPEGGGGGEMRSTLVSHGDGTHHIEHEDGQQSEHPHIGHALMAMAGKHSDGKHLHTHSDGMGGGHTVHTSEHGGEPEGSEHENVESVKDHMSQFFDDEGGESNEHDEGGKKEGKSGESDGKDWE